MTRRGLFAGLGLVLVPKMEIEKIPEVINVPKPIKELKVDGYYLPDGYSNVDINRIPLVSSTTFNTLETLKRRGIHRNMDLQLEWNND